MKEHNFETFSFVVKHTTMSFVLSIDFSRDQDIKKLDVNNDFLNCDLKKVLYMSQPRGFEV